jgi:1,4-dihydroxy-2-naphthoate octaprenyltransferase
MDRLWLFVQLSRPYFILGAALVYALGLGIARYLGLVINWQTALLGQAWVTMMQLSTHYLNEYFDSPADQQSPNRTPFSGGSGATGAGKLSRNVPLWAGLTTLTVTASLTVLLIRDTQGNPAILLILILIFLGAFFYSTPPLRLASSGYGELTTAILVSNLVPALAFLLQSGELHRLVAMTTFPLTFLHISMMLALHLPDYGADLNAGKRTLMVRVGWENGMRLHNTFILVAYLVAGIALLFGLPGGIGLPVFLTLPLGLFQIWYMGRIADGIRPNWSALTFTAVALYGLTAYLITFALWTR